MEPDTQTMDRAKRQAYQYLACRSQTRRELRGRLQRRGFRIEVIDNVLRDLEAEGYVDDHKFALNWARYRLQNKPIGRRRLAWELQQRGVPLEFMEEVVRKVYSEFDEVTLAEQAIFKHLRRKGRLLSPRERQRCFRYLFGLGFDADTIAAALAAIPPSMAALDVVSDADQCWTFHVFSTMISWEVRIMKEIVMHLPDITYAQFMAEAASARMSLAQWIVEEISTAASPKAFVEEAHISLAVALELESLKCLQVISWIPAQKDDGTTKLDNAQVVLSRVFVAYQHAS